MNDDKHSAKRPAKPRPTAAPGAPPPAESVAGEEDPGSALEQFSDLMQDFPAQGRTPADASAPRPPHAPHRRRVDDAEPPPEPDDRRR